MLPFKDTGY